MEWREIARTLAKYLFGLSLVLCLPLAVAFFLDDEQNSSVYAFLATMGATLALSFLLYILSRGSSCKIWRREGLLLVTLIWLLTPLFGGLPFYLSRTFPQFSQCYFEATSGFTTAGMTVACPKIYNEKNEEIPHQIQVANPQSSTVYTYFGSVEPLCDSFSKKVVATGIEAIPKGLLFWRSFMQWIGGIGVVLLFVTVLPALGVGAKVLMQAEMTGPLKEGIVPRMRQTAKLFSSIYAALTCLQVVLMKLAMPSLPWFDAVTLAMSTISTGGFSVRNEGLQAYRCLGLESIVVTFMLLGSLHFGLYYALLQKQYRRLKDPELLVYGMILFFLSCFVILNIWGPGRENYPFAHACRNGFFQMVSAMTSTGFTFGHYNDWPYFSKALLMLSMFLGGMAGSTSGGMKIIRVYLLSGLVRNKLVSLLRPETVRTFHIGSTPIPDAIANTVFTYFLLMVVGTLFGTLFYMACGMDPETSLTLCSCMINNGGLAFQAAGPMGEVTFLSPLCQYFSCFLMILGRLEFFVICLLFLPQFWRVR